MQVYDDCQASGSRRCEIWDKDSELASMQEHRIGTLLRTSYIVERLGSPIGKLSCMQSQLFNQWLSDHWATSLCIKSFQFHPTLSANRHQTWHSIIFAISKLLLLPLFLVPFIQAMDQNIMNIERHEATSEKHE